MRTIRIPVPARAATRLAAAAAVIAAVGGGADPAAAQNRAYLDLLRFDLVSWRSQATAGMHEDDLEKVAAAARLLEIDGNRLYTSFANLSEPATLGDNLVTWGRDRTGSPSSEDVLDSGSYLGGWTGRIDAGSDWVFSVFYQRNHDRGAFEDLQDGLLGEDPLGGSAEAGHAGVLIEAFDDGTGANVPDDLDPDRTETTRWDLERWDDRTASNLDLGAAREISADLALGARIFVESDRLDRYAGGTRERVFRRKVAPGGPLVTTARVARTWSGDGEDAYRQREAGVSLDADFHPWAEQSLNVRFDVFSTSVTNPASGVALPSRAGASLDALPEDPTGAGVSFWEQTEYAVVTAGADGFAPNLPMAAGGLGELERDRENRVVTTGSYSLGDYGTTTGAGLPIARVDDERSGVGTALLVAWDRYLAGGDARTWAGWTRRPYDLDATVVEREYARDTFWWNAGDGDREAVRTTVDQEWTTTRRGDATVSAWELGGRWTRRLNHHVSLGLGLVVTRHVQREEYAQSVVAVASEGFDDGDDGDNALYDARLAAGFPDAAFNERSVVATTTWASDVDHEARTTTTRLPVGVTFRWGEGGRWGWNMGTLHAIHDRSSETTVATPASDGGRTIRIESDVLAGVEERTTRDADALIERGTTTGRERWNTTTYFYGFEWRPTEATQFNVNGFLDTHADEGDEQILDVDFLRSLAVSLTFRFL